MRRMFKARSSVHSQGKEYADHQIRAVSGELAQAPAEGISANEVKKKQMEHTSPRKIQFTHPLTYTMRSVLSEVAK